LSVGDGVHCCRSWLGCQGKMLLLVVVVGKCVCQWRKY
jgi:hypothetical protein